MLFNVICRLTNMMFKNLYVVKKYMSFKNICRLCTTYNIICRLILIQHINVGLKIRRRKLI